MRVWVDLRVNGLAQEAHNDIVAIPGVTLAGHPDAGTLRIGVPVNRATMIAEEIETILEMHGEQEKEEPTNGTQCEPECSYTPINLPDTVSVSSGGNKGKGAEVMLPGGRIGTVTRTYTSWRDGKERTMLVVRISKSKTKTAFASACKVVSAAT